VVTGNNGVKSSGENRGIRVTFCTCLSTYITIHENYVRVLQRLCYHHWDKTVHSALGGDYLSRRPGGYERKNNPRRAVDYSFGVHNYENLPTSILHNAVY
jgi:hypothetical protein